MKWAKALTLGLLALLPLRAMAAPDFNHAVFDDYVQSHMHGGRLDYRELQSSGTEPLDEFLATLASTDPRRLGGEAERMGFWLYACRACLIKAVASGEEVDQPGALQDPHFVVGGLPMSIDEMEHQLLLCRVRRDEPLFIPPGLADIPRHSVVSVVAPPGPRYTFDQSMLDNLLKTYVRDGKIDYGRLRGEGRPLLNAYLATLAVATPDRLATTSERLAFWLNAYNACSIQGTLDGGNLDTKAGRHKFQSEPRYQVAGHPMSLDDMEHQFMGEQRPAPYPWYAPDGGPIIRVTRYGGKTS